ncbi:hypothetical protein J3R83DRAFT_1544 [Lanmaoa asiatica]|nr:hypothetical protein J3R83DRAFT_1544 [Lanmaoa asiatica]
MTILVYVGKALVGIFSLTTFAALFPFSSSAHVTSIVTLGDTFFTDLSIAYCSVAAGVDISIAIALTYLLARRRIATGFKHSARVLQVLTVFAINSGIWTAIFALLTIILLRAFPSELIYVVFDFPLCSIYCNTLLANLNARSYIKNQASTLNVGADLITDSRESRSKHSTVPTELKLFASRSQETKPSELSSSMDATDVMDVSHPTKAPAL